MSADSKAVMHELLYRALLQIRVDCNGRGDATQIERAHYLADMAHNWPHGLEKASSTHEFEAMLREAWRRCNPWARPWLEVQLRELGVDPSSL